MKLELWEQCLSYLESELSEQQFNTWILPLQIEITDNQLCLLAPNRFVMDWVKKNFLDQIRNIVLQLDDSKSMDVSIGIGSQSRVASSAKDQVKSKSPAVLPNCHSN